MTNDSSQRATPSAPDALAAWHRLLQVSSRVVEELDRRLDLEHRLSVNEFDVLINLDNAEPRLRMTDLASAVMLSSGGLTRLVGRLEDRRLVQREPDTGDGRGSLASLTESGRTLLTEARITHDAVIVDLVGSRLSPPDVRTLTRVLGRVLAPET